MRVRGAELPWCTGPGWYFCHYASGDNGHWAWLYSPCYETAFLAHAGLIEANSQSARIFEVTQADIEAES